MSAWKASDLPPHLRQQLGLKKKGRYSVSSKMERTEDGILFDSKWECRVYKMLKLLVPKEAIQMQVPFVIIDTFNTEGFSNRSSSYRLDFMVGNVCIDAKGHKTDIFRLKKKLFEHRYGLKLHCPTDKKNFGKNMAELKKILGPVLANYSNCNL